MNIAFYTLGCKVNQYETQVLAEQFAAAGFCEVPHTGAADVYLVNSCTVTASGDGKTRRILRRLRAQNPSARIVLTGCFPQAFPEEAAALPEADLVTGARDRARLVALVTESLARRERIVSVTPHDRAEPFEPMHLTSAPGHTRAFVKIEDGCERYCSYCIIPSARGPVRSKQPDALRAELEGLVQSGYREVVLVGINLSCYGQEWGLRLADAAALACGVQGLERVRLGSLEPERLTDGDLARMAALPALCPHFHMSLQSGCDATLRRMNRQYTAAQYRELAGKLRAHFPDCALTTDILVGFPGESEQEFLESCAFVEQIGFAQAHVFAYSPRPGTRAARMEGQVPHAVKAVRSARMIELSARARAAFLRAQVGTTTEVLFENRFRDGMWEGHARNYTPVRVPSGETLWKRQLPVLLRAAEEDACVGTLFECGQSG